MCHKMIFIDSNHDDLFEAFGPLKSPPIWNNPTGRHFARDLSETTAPLKITIAMLLGSIRVPQDPSVILRFYIIFLK